MPCSPREIAPPNSAERICTIDTLLQFLSVLLTIYILCMFAYALIGWLPMISPGLAFNSTVMSLRRFLESVCGPWIRVFRFVPPVPMGGMQLDMSFLVAMLVLVFGGPVVLNLIASAVGG